MAASFLAASALDNNMDIIVNVKQGSLRGKISTTVSDREYFSFTGIPYAKPPIGNLRFKAPEPPEPWNDVREATKNGHMSPQLEVGQAGVCGNEDCLILNVYTPILPKAGVKPKPVVVYIHGGGYAFGSSHNFAPDYYLEKNLVVVSLHYRLNILGFLCLDLPGAQGNMGLKDQVMALKWIKQNIACFGGDPNNVTLLGYSAGGSSVDFLMVSKMATGLFHKAISHSGSFLNPWALDLNPEKVLSHYVQKLGRKFENKEELYIYLMDAPLEEVIPPALFFEKPPDTKAGAYFGFVPVVEKGHDSFLSEDPLQIIKRGDFTKVPYITGVARNEGLLMCVLFEKSLKETIADGKYVEKLPFKLGESEKADMQVKLNRTYIDAVDDPEEAAINFYSDVDFCGGVWHSAKIMARHGVPVYFYEFAYDGGLNYVKFVLNIKHAGACHLDEAGYMTSLELLQAKASRDDKLVRRRLIDMWTDFIHSGNPTPTISEHIRVTWSPLTEDEPNYLVIDKSLAVEENFEPLRMQIFEQLYENNWSVDRERVHI